MAKFSGGRSNFSGRIQYSPHPREALKELRELGVSDSDIKRFRREANRYKNYQADIVNYNVKHGVELHTTIPSYESIINSIKYGYEKPSNAFSNAISQLKESREIFEERGITKDLYDAMRGDIDFVNDILEDDYIDETVLDSMDSRQITKTQDIVNQLRRYTESKAYDGYKVGAAIDSLLDELKRLIDEVQ